MNSSRFLILFGQICQRQLVPPGTVRYMTAYLWMSIYFSLSQTYQRAPFRIIFAESGVCDQYASSSTARVLIEVSGEHVYRAS